MKNLKIKKERRKLIKIFGFKSNWQDLHGHNIIKRSRIRLPLIIKKKDKLIVLSLVRRNKLRGKIVKRFKFEKPQKNFKTLIPKRLYRKRRKLKKTLVKKLKRLIHRKKRLRLKNFLKFRNKFFEKKPVFNKSYIKTKKFATKLRRRFKNKRKYLLLNLIKGFIKNNSQNKKIKLKKLKLSNFTNENNNYFKNTKINKFKKKSKIKKKKIDSVTLNNTNSSKKLHQTKNNLLIILKKKFAFNYKGVKLLMHRKLRKKLREKKYFSFPLIKFSALKRTKKLKIKKWIKIFIKNNKLHPFFLTNILKSFHFFKISKNKKMIKWNLNYLSLVKNVNKINITNKKSFITKAVNKINDTINTEGNLKQKNVSQIKRLKILLFYKKSTKKRVRKATVNVKNRHLNKSKRLKITKYWPWWQILWKYKNEKRKKRKEGKFANLLFNRKRKKKIRHSPLNLWRQNYINNKFLRTFYVCKIKELNNFFFEHQKQKLSNSDSLLLYMEKRILTFLFRVNLFNSIYFIKQLIRHGFISINGKIIRKETYKMGIKDELEIITKSKAHKKKWMIHILLSKMYTTHIILNYPKYIEMNYKLLKGKFIRGPKKEELYFTNNIKLNNRFHI